MLQTSQGFRDGTGGGDVATIDVGIEALKLAEFITKSVKRQLGNKIVE